MHTASTTQPKAPDSYNAWLPAELRAFADRDNNWRGAHQDVVVHGIEATDRTVPNPGAYCYEGKGEDLIWVGCYGEGVWLRPEEVLEIAEALRLVAHAHIDRVFAKTAAERGIAAPVSQGSAA